MTSSRAGFELGSVTYLQNSETYRFEYDQDKTTASMAVVTALSEAMDVAPIELEPLHTTLDTDALDTLARVRDTTNGDVNTTFTHEGWTITVHNYGVVAVAPVGHERTDDQPTDIAHK